MYEKNIFTPGASGTVRKSDEPGLKKRQNDSRRQTRFPSMPPPAEEQQWLNVQESLAHFSTTI